MEIIKRKSKSNRLTINPNIGRVTLKLFESNSDLLNKRLIKFTECIVKQFSENITYRGKFYNIDDMCVDIVMYTHNQKFPKQFQNYKV